uniref:Uncharacterized protein AlNc14C1G24 n=1 Tax=Albugo laibachii Nc14 TaxID=890382 RepID=F0VYL7_9STRA|nr:conserved hypothetical protein [Albugo laibachii Nc14]|eukprot:CCA13881.1 conserved hypothetical protein [Albugo laibachii Nc14]
MWFCVTLLVVGLHVTSSSRIAFQVSANNHECFYEENAARASTTLMTMRFGVLKGSKNDKLAVAIHSPSGRILSNWTDTQAEHTTSQLHEFGMYSICYRRLGGSYKINVFHTVELIPSGIGVFLLYPATTATLQKRNPAAADYGIFQASDDEKGLQFGIVDFNLESLSPSMINDRSRAFLSLSIRYNSTSDVRLQVAHMTDSVQYPLEWSQFKSHIENLSQREIDEDHATSGSHTSFDITEYIEHAMKEGKNAITLTIHAKGGSIAIDGMSHTPASLYPRILIEEEEIHSLLHIKYLKTRILDLRGEISYIIQREEHSRDAAESTNSRVKWFSLIINAFLMCIAIIQVLYVRKILEGGY